MRQKYIQACFGVVTNINSYNDFCQEGMIADTIVLERFEFLSNMADSKGGIHFAGNCYITF